MPLLDVLAAALVTGVLWVPPSLHRGPVYLIFAVVAAAAMILRRRMPVVSTVAAAIATVAGGLLGVSHDPMLATAWCLYPVAVARAAGSRWVLAVAGLALAAVTAGVPKAVLLSAAALCVSWLLGALAGREAAAERTRVQLAVARDVHDVVGHALGTISAEAGVTRSLPDADEDELRESLAGIEIHARAAMQEVQALVRGMRTESLELQAVIASTRAAGVPVDARIDVPGPVGPVVVRTVQEALSNVLRHSGGARCAVDVRRAGRDILVSVRDDGPGAPAGLTPGSGLRGMGERARLAGGAVSWGNHPQGGFEVRARLPGERP